MEKYIKFVIAVLLITSLSDAHCFADMQGEGPDRDIDVAFEDDTAPIVNCKTAEGDIAALEKQIADIKTNLVKEVEGIVPTSAPEEAGIIDPTKDIQAGQAKEQELAAQVANIKQVCGLGE